MKKTYRIKTNNQELLIRKQNESEMKKEKTRCNFESKEISESKE